MGFLSLEGEDLDVALAVVEIARKRRDDELKWFANYVSGRTAGLTAQAITRWFSRTFKKK